MDTFRKYLSESGITLLEVMVAVAVASIVLVSLISLVSSAITMEDNARKLTEATVVADNMMKEIERTGYPEVGYKEGLVDKDDSSDFTFKQTVIESPIEDVRIVQLQVLWNKGKNSVDFAGYIAKR
ncbi:MAG: hypothetical protein A4E62_00916 [Syntrophorhabdus sp. PtaU1.Bin002]|nr:MAG: hypothetical protein A4E58_00092 [Syntrophorhabdus sp. PtaB.Bin006]OPY72311.1 MAG: hypothetical protein A4E62_00916 [Syntrophorhabdus sp. PtaU1.Bin002]